MNHMYYYGGNLPWLMGLGGFGAFGLFPILLWSLAWKGWALWLAARRREPIWFAVLLVVNTMGLLEIFYIFVIAKRDDTEQNTDARKTTQNHTSKAAEDAKASE